MYQVNVSLISYNLLYSIFLQKKSDLISYLWSNILILSSNPRSVLLQLHRYSFNIYFKVFLYFLIVLTSLLKISPFLVKLSISISLSFIDSIVFIITLESFLFEFLRLFNYLPSSNIQILVLTIFFFNRRTHYNG